MEALRLLKGAWRGGLCINRQELHSDREEGRAQGPGRGLSTRIVKGRGMESCRTLLGDPIVGLERRLLSQWGGVWAGDPVLNLGGGARFWCGRPATPGLVPGGSPLAAPAWTTGLQGRPLTSPRRHGGRCAACSPCAIALPSSRARTRCQCPR